MNLDFFRKEDPDLDEAIARNYEKMKDYLATSLEYSTIADQQTKLYALKAKPQTINPDTLIIAGSNLLIALAVLRFEQDGVITSKIWTFLGKHK